MKSHRGIDRSKPASGAESLKYFDKKFHNEFITKAKSCIRKEFNDKSWAKYKAHIESKTDFRQ